MRQENLFFSIDYLQSGNERQQKAYQTLIKHRVMDRLKMFTPLLTGTIPIAIDIESSDLDVICCYKTEEEFKECLALFAAYPDYKIEEKRLDQNPTIIATFRLDDFPVEIFGQPIPVTDQLSYRHLIIENRILQWMGETFREHIIKLKKEGLKTEPAFAQLLKLSGNPYEALCQIVIPDF